MIDTDTLITKQELLTSGETAVNTEIQRARALTSCVTRSHTFSRDDDDEFTIIREDGATEGIFKTWAVPIIPFIESGELDELKEVIARHIDGKDLLDELPERLSETLERWNWQLEETPTRLWETLEKSRVEAQIADRRLSTIFSETPLSEDPHERIAQLLARMHIAFGYAAPFYHIEAMVGDGNDTIFNPARLNEENGGGGALDVAALALPSAISSAVVAERLNWNGLNWDAISDIVNNLPEAEQELVLKLASQLDVSATEIVFAANVLEFIPVSVGGKKGDLPREAAIELINAALENRSDSKGSVVRDMNALIRFMNWFPSIKSQANFDNGTLWSYAAVCDTASKLVDEINGCNDAFKGDFNRVFETQLSEQLSNLDATSAKGRFLLSLLLDGKFSDDIALSYNQELEKMIETVGRGISNMKQAEAIVDCLEPNPRALVGGKAAGIAEAAQVIGPENFVRGQVITSEWVSDWIATDPNITAAIQLLNNQTDPHVRQFWAKEITRMIYRLEVPSDILERVGSLMNGSNLVCVRSSSLDEDTQINGSAAGIYDSAIGIEPHAIGDGIRQVVASFFSQTAIAYRELHGFPDIPSMALLVTPFHKGPGGVVFSRGDGENVDIEVAESPQHIVAGSITGDASHLITDDNMEKLKQTALKLESIRGSQIDMEFVEEDGRLIILQARALRAAKHKHQEQVGVKDIPRSIEIDDLNALPEVVTAKGERYSLCLGRNINVNQFQGPLFRWLVKNKGSVHEIVLKEAIPATSHFANICLHLGIEIKSAN